MHKSDTPGPGSYEGLIKHKAGISISGVKNKRIIEITPGPGAYDTADEDQSKRPCSAKMGLANRSNMSNFHTPGPGTYNINNQ